MKINYAAPMLDINEQSIAATTQVHIVPNPMKNQSRIIIEGQQMTSDATLVLYNLIGSEVLRMKLNSEISILDKNNLPSGLYIYVITGKEMLTKGKLAIE